MSASLLVAQSSGDVDLEGGYRYQAITVGSGDGIVAEVAAFRGLLEFDEDGFFITNSTRRGYWREPGGIVTVDGFLDGFGSFDARIGAGAETLIGVSESVVGGGVAVLVAVSALDEAFSAANFRDAYQAALVTFPTAGAMTPTFSYAPFDAGQAVLTVGADGTGTLTVPAGAGIGVTQFQVSVSADGGMIIGEPTAMPGLLIASRREAGSPAGPLWLTELSFNRAGPEAAAGGLVFSDATRARIHERWMGPRGMFDFRGVSAFALQADGAGTLDATPVVTTAGGGLLGGRAGMGSGLLLLAVPAPMPADDGVFANPHGNVSAASLSPAGAPAAPGELRSLFGAGRTNGVAAAASLPLPTDLLGSSILVGGAAAPLLFVSPFQVNYQAPESAGGPVLPVAARNGSEESDEILMRLAATSAAVFTLDGSGGGAGIFTHADFTLVSAAAPARSGETVIAFRTGLGVNQPLPRVWVAGLASEVAFAGRAPGFVGLDQMNFRIPVGTPTGGSVPFTIATRDGWSDTVTIAIGQ